MFSVDDAIVFDSSPDISECLPTAKKLMHVPKARDLISKNKFPTLLDRHLHVIFGIRDYSLIKFNIVRDPEHINSPYVGISWTVCIW